MTSGGLEGERMERVIVLMGVSGSGKTTVGRALAARLGCPFYDGDAFHSPVNVSKMSAGEPLTDEDRWPWLDRLAGLIREQHEGGETVVLACSALKRSYRERLQIDNEELIFVFLRGSFDFIWERMRRREDHYMKASMLQSQFDDLEEPEPTKALVVDVDIGNLNSTEEIVTYIIKTIYGGSGQRLIIPSSFAERIGGAFGVDGEQWLEDLPRLLQEIAAKWSLTLQAPFEDMAYNYVAPAIRQDGRVVVLKVGVPNPELYTEMEALRLFGGEGVVKLMDADRELGAMMLERLTPGQPVYDLGDDEKATALFCQVVREMKRPCLLDEVFPTVASWAKGLQRLRAEFGGGTGPFPKALVERAESDLWALLESMGEPILLHGDLHHWNILSAQRSPWLAIDPKGVIGELEYEIGAWLRNPVPEILRWLNPAKTMKRRVSQTAGDLSLDPQRILAWGIYQAVLSAWWSYEDGGSWEEGVAIAELIAQAE